MKGKLHHSENSYVDHAVNLGAKGLPLKHDHSGGVLPYTLLGQPTDKLPHALDVQTKKSFHHCPFRQAVNQECLDPTRLPLQTSTRLIPTSSKATTFSFSPNPQP